MFESIQAAPPDAILGLNEAFRNDPREGKINLTVGVYKDETGLTPILDCVKAAEKRIVEEETSKGYLPIDGDAEYCRLVAELNFGVGHEVLESGRAATAQAPGGTGALRVAGDFLTSTGAARTIWCSTPTWPNHPKVFQASGLEVKNYAYFDADQHGVNLDGMLAAIAEMSAGDVICLHACCHNPTGADPSAADWKQIADAVYGQGLTPLLDFAYLGFGTGIDEDAVALREFARPGAELIVASSCSKNFGLYRERVGSLTVVTKDADAAKAVASQIKSAVRVNYSNPPSHGGAIVRTVLGDAGLRSQWEGELAAMRNRINGMRTLFTQKMSERLPDADFSFIEKQNGMFSFSGLTAEQVDRLKDEHAVYAVRSGRINVAGIMPSNVDALCDAIAAVSS
jgi:aspartate/tyrosine/aromatic aminotransferase